MRRVAVLGANGFIGNRTVEMLRASGLFEVRPVVRRASAAALPCRFDLEVHVADGRDSEALVKAFHGCDSVVVAIAGDPATIVNTIDPVVRAARAASVRRLVYLSSASVHGQSPLPGTDESSPLSSRQPLAYNNAKVAAERRLMRLASDNPEIVVLRPGIVFGPRSQWVGGWADELLAGEAYTVEGAQGVCNAIYVDDLVRAIVLAIDTADARGAYLLGQKEQVAWRDFCEPIAAALGVPFETVPDHSAAEAQPERGPSLRERLRPVIRRVRPFIPAKVRGRVRAAIHAGRARADGGGRAVSLERALLHTARHRPSWDRARTELGYEPLVSFDEGLKRSIAWLAFAGYPVKGAP